MSACLCVCLLDHPDEPVACWTRATTEVNIQATAIVTIDDEPVSVCTSCMYALLRQRRRAGGSSRLSQALDD